MNKAFAFTIKTLRFDEDYNPSKIRVLPPTLRTWRAEIVVSKICVTRF